MAANSGVVMKDAAVDGTLPTTVGRLTSATLFVLTARIVAVPTELGRMTALTSL